ncbi:MAG: UDP-galactopyranose mutase [Prevotella sp.]|jgi:UDP-galactopyranose mutase|nr:UDP-galactopyranose mutase [Prevotella sp.]
MPKSKPYDYLIVGTGLFGSVFAYLAKQKGKKCLLVDKRSHTGGNIYCENINSINVHKYGAHIFHTSNKEVWHFVNSFVEFNNYINSPLAYYKGKLYNLPFNMNTFNRLWGVNTPAEAKQKLEEQRGKYATIKEPANLEEQALKLCGEDIYYTFIKEYTEKQWGRSAIELPAFIIRRVPFRFTYNNNYFNDIYQGIPIGGFNRLTEGLLEDIEVRLNTNYLDNKEYFDSLAHKTIFTGCIDEYFGLEYGKLEYRGLHFEHEQIDIEDFQGNAVVNYNERSVPYTRIIEHKHFEFGTQPTTVVTREYPGEYAKNNEPYYPVNDNRNTVIYNKYKEKALQYPHLYFGGRLGQYAYFDMDDSVEQAMLLAKKELDYE